MSEENKSGYLSRILRLILKSPVNTLFIIFLAYFALKVYLWDGGLLDKAAMIGIIGLWMFWFIAKHMLLLFLVLLLLGGGFYWYYSGADSAQSVCEEDGGIWDSKTKTCRGEDNWLSAVKKIWR